MSPKAVEAPFTEISPLCEQDVQCVRVPQTCPSETPTGSKSIKRKFENDSTANKENLPVS